MTRDDDGRDLRGSRGTPASSRRLVRRRRTARRRASGRPGRARSPGIRRGARLCPRARAQPLRARGDARIRGGRRDEHGKRAARRAAASTRTTSRRPSADWAAPAPCTTSHGRRRWTSRKRGTGASPRPACTRRRSSTASGSARSTSASRAASSSSSQRSVRASRVDEDPDTLGEKLILPPAFEHVRAQVEPILTPLPDPRPWARTFRLPRSGMTGAWLDSSTSSRSHAASAGGRTEWMCHPAGEIVDSEWRPRPSAGWDGSCGRTSTAISSSSRSPARTSLVPSATTASATTSPPRTRSFS